MSRLISPVTKLSKQKIITGTITDVLGPRCSVRLSGRGKVLHSLGYVGPAPVVGSSVIVDFRSGSPTVHTNSSSMDETIAELQRSISVVQTPVISAPPGESVQHTHALGELSDVNAAAPVHGQFLMWDDDPSGSAAWVPTSYAPGSWDGDITDLDETSSADIGEDLNDSDQFIVFNASASAWVRSALSRIKTFLNATFAPVANGVTNGDSHDHNGGDGAQVSYLNLSSLPTTETNANDIYRCDSPGGASLWTGTISGTPSGVFVTVSAPTSGTEAVLVPTSTSQLAKMRLYNLTRGNSALISNYNTGSNVVTLTATVPANWANSDSLTVVSQTVSGGGLNWIDLEITSGPTSKANMFVTTVVNGSAAGERVVLHPFEAFGSSKLKSTWCHVAAVQNDALHLLKITTNLFAFAWTGTPSYVMVREQGYLS